MSLSLACNGNSAICCGFSTLTNLSSLSSLPLEPTDKASPCAGSQFNNHSNKKGLPKVVLFYYWRWWESNPRPSWIKTNIYECSILFSRINTEICLTLFNPKTFSGSLTGDSNLDTHTIICVLHLAYFHLIQRQAGHIRGLIAAIRQLVCFRDQS